MTRTLPMLALFGSLLGGCAHARLQALEGEVAQRDAVIAQVRAENQGYVIQIDTLKSQLDDMSKKNAELSAMYEGILHEFEPDLRSGVASLVVFPDRSLVAIGDSLTFESGSADLTASGKEEVSRLATLLKQHPGRRFQVEGHTDPEPIATARYPSNWELGAERAIVVVKELIDQGVAPAQLSAATYAENSPIAFNDGDAGMAQNRRISVALQTGVTETGAQTALYKAAQESGRAVVAASARPTGDQPTFAQR